MTAKPVRKKAVSKVPVKKGGAAGVAKKRRKKSGAPVGPIVLTPAQECFLEQIVLEGMTRMRWTRAYAERKARTFLSKATTPAKLRLVAAKLGRLDDAPPAPEWKPPKAKAKKPIKLSRAEIAKLPPVVPSRPAPKTALQRLERALGPDDGKRRRGGSPVLQGGSPGLGRRR